MQVSDKSEEAFSCSLQAIELAQQRVDTHFSYTSYAEGLDDMSEASSLAEVLQGQLLQMSMKPRLMRGLGYYWR